MLIEHGCDQLFGIFFIGARRIPASTPHRLRDFKSRLCGFSQFGVGMIAGAGAFQDPACDLRPNGRRAGRKMAANVVQDAPQRGNNQAI
jgi:hypothetical protein